MVDCDALVVIEYDKLCQILNFKYKFVDTFKDDLAIQFIASPEQKNKDVVLNIRLNLGREADLH